MSLSTSLVLETNNLHGGSHATSKVASSMARLLTHLKGQSWGLDRLQELVITHCTLSRADQHHLESVAGVKIRWVKTRADVGYYEAKNLGFEATTSDIVAFGDADCLPHQDWLKNLFSPLIEQTESFPIQVVAGRTTYCRNLLGTAASTIDFMYFESPFGKNCTRNFYANNVAFLRETFSRFNYKSTKGFYRGNCQVLGMKIFEAGIPILFQPSARTYHRFPDTTKEFVKLRILRGMDLVELSPHLVKSVAPRAIGPMNFLKPIVPHSILMMRLGYSFRSVGKQEMPKLRTPISLMGCALAIIGISACDGMGALAGILGFSGDDLFALSYHRD